MKYKKLTFNIINTPKPHFFIGSKIRGTLGYALKNEVCINPTFECKDCFAIKECIFYKFYEEQNVTHRYRFDFKLYSNKYKFSLLLFEDSIKHKDSIKNAMLNSLSQYKKIEYKDKEKEFKSKEKCSSIIKLEFLTPLRIKKGNIFALDNISLNDMLFSIHRRFLEIQNRPFVRIEFSKSVKIVSKNLRYQEITRKSNKQNTKMNLGGIMGEIVLSNVDTKTYNLLKLGEVIGVGKSTVFGLGKIKIEDIN